MNSDQTRVSHVMTSSTNPQSYVRIRYMRFNIGFVTSTHILAYNYHYANSAAVDLSNSITHIHMRMHCFSIGRQLKNTKTRTHFDITSAHIREYARDYVCVLVDRQQSERNTLLCGFAYVHTRSMMQFSVPKTDRVLNNNPDGSTSEGERENRTLRSTDSNRLTADN